MKTIAPLAARLVLATLSCLPLAARAVDATGPGAVAIDPQLGKQAPMQSTFVDEGGKAVVLGSLIDKPTILALVYYECPNICGPLLTNLGELIDAMPLQAGKDYAVIAISFNEKEDSALAAQKKENFLRALKKPIPPDAWRFLTGDAENIKALTDAVGFHFQRQGDDFVHPTALILLAKDGKITRYLQGMSYIPADVEMALREAAQGAVGATRPPADQSMGPSRDRNRLLSICFSYDPKKNAYLLSVTRLAGAVVLILAALFAIVLLVRSTRGQRSKQP